MRIRFSLRALLLATAFIATTIAGWLAVPRWIGWLSVSPLATAAALSPYWVPFVFVAYMIGRRELGGRVVLAFFVAEVAVFGPVLWVYWTNGWPLW